MSPQTQNLTEAESEDSVDLANIYRVSDYDSIYRRDEVEESTGE